MLKTESGIFIPLQDLQREPARIENFDQLQAHLEHRAGHFSWVLQRLHKNLVKSARDKTGWHTVFPTKEGPRKIRGKDQKIGDGVFTGDNLCFVASFAAKEALEEIAPGMQFDIVQVEADMSVEIWNEPGIALPEEHNLLLATHGEEKNLIDFTYGQFDHRYAGSVLVSAVPGAERYYRNQKGRLSFKSGMGISKYDLLMYGDIHLGLSEKDYNRLVKTLK